MAQEPTSGPVPDAAGQGGALSGKWQIPLLAVATACLVAAVVLLFFTVVEREATLSSGELLDLAEGALAASQYVQADEWSQEFQKSYPADPSIRRIREIEGDANFNLGLRAFEDQAALFKKAERAYLNAGGTGPGEQPSPSILLKLGRTRMRLGEPRLAVNCYETALANAPADPLAIHMAKIDALLSITPEADLEAALTEIQAVRTQLPSLDSDEVEMVTLKEADILNARGEYAEAERKLEALLTEQGRSRSTKVLIDLSKTHMRAGEFTKALDTLHRVVTEPTGSGGTEVTYRAQAFLMFGLVFAAMQNENEALKWFERTASEFPAAPEALAARLGVAQTYLALEELDSAKQAYAEIRDEIRKLPPGQNPWINLAAARNVLKVRSELCVVEGRYDEALEFLIIEQSILRNPDRDLLLRRADILCKVAEVAAARTEQPDLDDPERLELRRKAERDWREAGSLYLTVADTFDGRTQKEYPDDLWLAVTCFLKAGAHEQAVEVLKTFIKYVPRDSRVPQAELELARQYEVLGKWSEAVETLQALTQQNGSTLPGFEGAYILGRTLIHMGPDFYQQAEDAFFALLENPSVSPSSLWYQKSLLELGRLMHRRGDYDRAILRLNEYIARYPDDTDVLSALYLLASSSRQQGLAALARRREAVRLTDKEALAEVHRQKLQSAVAQYEQLVKRYEQLSPEQMTVLRRQEYQGILFDLADSLFELGRTDEAIAAYGVVIYRLQTSPDVMSAYVQLARAHLMSGRTDQYMAVLERARWTLEKIPDEAFARQLGTPSKAYWQNWIRTLQAERPDQGASRVSDRS